jgi:hypothetical protein
MARGYFRHLAIAVDQLANAVLAGWPDETLSSRTGRYSGRQPWKVLEVLFDWLFEHVFRQGPNHCKNAIQKEKSRYHFHKDMR